MIEWPEVPLEHFVVAPDLAGQQNIVLGAIGGVRIEAGFPAAPTNSYVSGDAWIAVGTLDKPVLVGIGRMKIRAFLTADLDTYPLINAERAPTDREWRDAENMLLAARRGAERVLTMFLDFAGQRHKRFLARIPTPLASLHETLYVDDPPRLAKTVRMSTARALTHGTDRPSLSTAEANSISQTITAGETPDLAWQLYGRALRLVVLEGNLRQAILEAAISVEVALDSAYRRVADVHAELEPIVGLLIKNLRSIDEQMKEGALAILGQSYASVSPVHYEQIKALMTERNHIVHDGAAGPTEVLNVERKLAAVNALLHWLDGLPVRRN
jgi:hypothetical protein